MTENRWRGAAILRVLLAGGLAVACGRSESASGSDGPVAGSGGAHAPDGSVEVPTSTGGLPGGSGGVGAGGRSVLPDAGAGGATGKGGRAGGGVQGTGGIRVGGAVGTGGVVRTGGVAVGTGGMVGTGGVVRVGGSTGGKGGVDGGGVDGGWPWPATLSKCSAATDEHLLAVVYQGNKAPEPYDWSANPGGTVTLSPTCASDFASARLLAAAALDVVDREDDTSPYFYEFADETSRGYVQLYRATKCEFYDGTVLGPSFRDLRSLELVGSYLWFSKNRSNASAKIVAGVPVATAATVDQFFLCWTLTVYGDWGLYDEIRYYERRYALDASGTVGIGADELLGTVQGRYNPNPIVTP